MIRVSAIIIMLLTCSFSLLAQNRLVDVMNINPGENYPTNMPNIHKWIEGSFGGKFISDLQFSQSPNGDARFLSFAFHSRAEYSVKLPGTEGFIMNFAAKGKTPRGVRTQTYRMEVRNDVKSFFQSFSPVGLTYSGREYFDYGIKYGRLSDGQLIANTLNYMIEPTGKKNKIKTFIDNINEVMKLKLAYPADESVKELNEILSKSGNITADVIFNTYIADKDKKQESKKLNNFFTVLTSDGIENYIDKMRLVTIKAGMDAKETITLPSNLFASGKTQADSLVAFVYSNFEATLDYKERYLEIRFMGNLSHPAQLTLAKEWRMNFETGNYEWMSIQDKNKITAMSELIVTVTETSITIEGYHEGYRYQLWNNKRLKL